MSMRAMTLERYYDPGEEFKTFFCGDIHAESKAHDRSLFVQEMQEAVEENADIIVLGDVFDLINHGDRKRFTPSSNKYDEDPDAVINQIIDEGVDLFTPYAKNIKAILCGNHEESTVKFHNLDLAQMLVYELNKLDGVHIEYLGYKACIRIMYRNKERPTKDVTSYVVHAWHGSGGGAEVTKGTITLNRMITSFQADLHVTAHTHTKVILPDERQGYMNTSGNLCSRQIKAMITGAYVFPIKETKTTRRDGRPKALSVDYGDHKRTLQSTGGIMLIQRLKGVGSNVTLTTKALA